MAAEKRRKRKCLVVEDSVMWIKDFALDSVWDLVLLEHPSRHG